MRDTIKRNGKVYTQIIPDAKAKTLLKIVKNKVKKNSTIYTDSYKSYDGLVFNGYKHQRINHSKEYVDGKNHINGIENFWSYCKMRLSKFHGLRPEDFYLHLKECEFRYNNRNEDLYKLMLQVIRDF